MKNIRKLKDRLSREFKMKDLSPIKKFLGIRINMDRSIGIQKLYQAEYVEKVIHLFNMSMTKIV